MLGSIHFLGKSENLQWRSFKTGSLHKIGMQLRTNKLWIWWRAQSSCTNDALTTVSRKNLQNFFYQKRIVYLNTTSTNVCTKVYIVTSTPNIWINTLTKLGFRFVFFTLVNSISHSLKPNKSVWEIIYLFINDNNNSLINLLL